MTNNQRRDHWAVGGGVGLAPHLEHGVNRIHKLASDHLHEFLGDATLIDALLTDENDLQGLLKLTIRVAR